MMGVVPLTTADNRHWSTVCHDAHSFQAMLVPVNSHCLGSHRPDTASSSAVQMDGMDGTGNPPCRIRPVMTGLAGDATPPGPHNANNQQPPTTLVSFPPSSTSAHTLYVIQGQTHRFGHGDEKKRYANISSSSRLVVDQERPAICLHT